MNDLGILLSDVNPGLKEIKNLFSLYAAATGAEMNFFKCIEKLEFSYPYLSFKYVFLGKPEFS